MNFKKILKRFLFTLLITPVWTYGTLNCTSLLNEQFQAPADTDGYQADFAMIVSATEKQTDFINMLPAHCHGVLIKKI